MSNSPSSGTRFLLRQVNPPSAAADGMFPRASLLLSEGDASMLLVLPSESDASMLPLLLLPSEKSSMLLSGVGGMLSSSSSS